MAGSNLGTRSCHPPSDACYFHAVIPRKREWRRANFPLFDLPVPLHPVLRACRLFMGLSRQSRSNSWYYLCLHNHALVFVSYFHAVVASPAREMSSSASPLSRPCVSSTSQTVTRYYRGNPVAIHDIMRVYTITPSHSCALFPSCKRRNDRCFHRSSRYGITGLWRQSRIIYVYIYIYIFTINPYLYVYSPLPLPGPPTLPFFPTPCALPVEIHSDVPMRSRTYPVM